MVTPCPTISNGDAEAIVATIAARMKGLRDERGLSLQEVASRTGMAKSHIWELEQGRARNPTISTAVGIARALGVSLDYLTGLSSAEPALHPEAMRIACEIDALLRSPPSASPALACWGSDTLDASDGSDKLGGLT